MAVYLFGITSVKYGTAATGSNMPSGVALTSLPDTVKGSVSIEETEGTVMDFFVDQKFSPIRSVKTEEGKLSATMQFYDMSFATMAVLKGGTGNDDGNGASLFQDAGVIYTGIITIAGTTPRYVVTEL